MLLLLNKENHMTIEEVAKYFGTGFRACQALAIGRNNFSLWRKSGRIPMLQQYRLEKLTNGELKAEQEIYD